MAPIPDIASTLSAGGLVVWFAWREVIPRFRNGNGSAGSRSADYWKNETRSQVASVLDDKLAPRLEEQTKILEELKRISGDTRDGVNKLVTLQENRR